MKINKSNTKKTPFYILILILFLTIFLSACTSFPITAETDITVYSGDKYDLKMTMKIPKDVLFFVDGPQEIESSLDEMVANAWEESRTKMTWKSVKSKDPDVIIYEIRIPKTKIDADDDVFTWSKVTYKNRKAYRIEFPDFLELGFQLSSTTLNLHAGKILETNGIEVDSKTVTWENPYYTPYAIVTPKNAVKWVPLVLAVLGLGALALVLVILLLTGKIKAWGLAAVDTGKWRVQKSKLSNQMKTTTQEKDALISKLAQQAWEARILHHSYTEPYFALEGLEEQKNNLAEETSKLNTELQEVRKAYAKVANEYSLKIKDLQTQQKTIGKDLNTVKIRQANLQNELKGLTQQEVKIKTEVAGYHQKLMQVQASDLADKDARIATLKDAIISLEGSLEKISTRMPEIEREIHQAATDQQPFEEQLLHLNDQITSLQNDQKNALIPFEQQAREIEQTLTAKSAEIHTIQEKMPPLIQSLGPLVESARPYSEELAEIYTQIDAVNEKLETATQEHGLMHARLEDSDKNAVRNFYILVAGVALVALVLIILFVIAFV